MTLQPGSPIGKYLVRRKLAEGGMAEIYLATVQGPEGFEKEVVIKRIRAFLATDPGFVQMFITEARVASRLNHANLVQIFDFDKHEDTYYLAMEYVRGHSLWDIRKRAKEQMLAMSPTLAAHVCTEVARGLAYAHRLTDKGKPLKLVHRDVTPHNVLVSYDGAVKLTDFGIAKAAGERLTSPGVLKGKFAYMSPEQARGDEVDGRSDVFSLGVVLWEMITGGRLFEGDSDVAVLKAVQKSVIPPPARLNPEVDEALDGIVMKALARELEQRYQSAQELERALAQHVLTVAETVDDTDLPAYLERLFPEDATASITTPELDQGGTGPGTPVTVSPAAALPLPPGDAPRLPADEDPDATTFVARRRKPPPPAGEWEGTTPEAPLAPPRDSNTVPALGPLPVLDPREAARGAAEPLRERPLSPRAVPLGRRLALAGLGLLAVCAGAAAVVRFAAPPSPPPSNSAPAELGEATLPSGEAPDAAGAGPIEPDEQAGTKGARGEATGAATGPPRAESPAPAAIEADADRLGVLVVRATPWATLFIDGKRIGEIDGTRRRIPLAPGAHTVLFQHPSRSRSVVVTIEPDREALREFNATH